MQAQYYAIGETAGKIYRLLEQKGEQTVTKAQKEIGADDAIFYQALGWLARENNVNFNKLGKTLKISLLTR
ncbi:MAG TPA: winged helix-turn-helix domain-containing protein [Candidatus Omnitrophota bacterium]|jgi:hypothetical protein|nr:MAG: hypothetical protein BWY49_00125 [Candidatus Omnitrophica bacterium ADurb.Bin314]HOE69292.1 winged helix-turn-helix domain-containing protein [Candidatus Omnitrophota bacterium]HPW65251.1 winged helix-turn-helix domain-containing protein [Candidatus Omnitrophota bacterium]HQB94491.1 winged helix-turn-helix domain-containing protein [Candidatus Omnitrophota bacterium]